MICTLCRDPRPHAHSLSSSGLGPAEYDPPAAEPAPDAFGLWFAAEFGARPDGNAVPLRAYIWEIQYSAAASAYLAGILAGRSDHAVAARSICNVPHSDEDRLGCIAIAPMSEPTPNPSPIEQASVDPVQIPGTDVAGCKIRGRLPNQEPVAETPTESEARTVESIVAWLRAPSDRRYPNANACAAIAGMIERGEWR